MSRLIQSETLAVTTVRRFLQRTGAAMGAALIAVTAGCGRSPAPAEPSTLGPSPRPSIVCPQPVVSQTLNGQPIAVSFAPPQAAGGVQPLSSACTPQSGTRFPIGFTNVACTVTDALLSSFTCGFTVRVLGPPRLSATSFLAFGDSITLGFVTDTYPGRLLAKLRQRFQTQNVGVFNEGLDGERASPGGQARLPLELNTFRPQVLLLIEGTNDLNGGAAGAGRAVEALTEMVRLAKGRGVIVFLGTIPPQRPGALRAFTQPQVPGFNDSVRGIAQREGVTLVDVYAAMIGDLSLIGPDDLHPNARGHEVMAQLFYDAITRQFELPPQ